MDLFKGSCFLVQLKTWEYLDVSATIGVGISYHNYTLNQIGMHQLYESKFQVLLYSEKDRLFISEWKHSRTRPSNEEYLEELHRLHSYFKKLKPLRYYSNISNLSYDLSKVDRNYAADLFKDDTAKYCAIVTNKIYFDSSVEEVVNDLEKISEDFTTQYFQDQNKAMKWLLECGTRKSTDLKNSQELVSQL